jgi:YcaO-like protein with predicted kinase domain
VTNPLPVSAGAGCHPDKAIALCRALTEAAQSRLTAIAGSRDDLGRQRYRETQSAHALNAFRAHAQGDTGRKAFNSIPDAAVGSVTDALNLVLTHLERAGLTRVLTVNLSTPGMPIAVVRTIVPGLEGPIDSPSYLPGARARARASGMHA